MAIDFPALPTLNQVYSFGNRSWTWNGTGWELEASSLIPSGTVMLFAQTAAPTGWTKSTTHNDKALRVVSGTASSGGTTAFTSVFASRTPAGTVGATTLTTSQIPAHSHVQQRATLGAATGQFSQSSTFSTTPTPLGYSTQDTGSGSSHTHTFTGTAMDFAVQYVDVILASKD